MVSTLPEKDQRAVIWLVNSLGSRSTKHRRLRRQPKYWRSARFKRAPLWDADFAATWTTDLEVQ